MVIAAESGLSFLGLGVQPPQATWGGMLRDAFSLARTRPFGLVAPSVMITLTILATFLVADAVRDALGRGFRDGTRP
jgi:peptide/nickel transport system permease protein